MEHEPSNPSEDAQAVREGLQLLIGQGRFKDAARLFRTVRPAFPQDAWLAATEAQVCLQLSLADQAAEAAADALTLGSDDPQTVLALGLGRRSQGRHAEAAEALLIAHRRLPDHVEASRALVEETAAAHGIDRARPIFAEVFARLPDHSIAVAWARLLFDAGLDDEMPPGVVSAPAMSVPTWIAEAGASLDFVGEREIIPVEDPPIYGEPDTPRFRSGVPGYIPYACSLPGATLFAKSSLVLTHDGAVLNDTLADERFGRWLDLFQDPTVLARRDQRLLLDVGRYRVREIEAGVMLSGWVSEHFGHWVPEYLCRLSYLVNHPRFTELPIIVDDDMPVQHLEYLSLVVPNPIVSIAAGEALRCGELVVASPSTFFPTHLTADHQVPPENQGGLSVGGFRFLQTEVSKRLPPPATRDRKLYLSRKSRSWRRLLNEDQVSEALAARGFEVLYPEDMSVEEQVRMYQGAKLVVAPNGASLLNAIFAPKEMTLIALSQRGLFNWGTFYGAMRELGYDLTFFCGEGDPDQKHANYSVPLPLLIEAIESLSPG